MTPECPFCGRDPFEYVDIGVGMEAVAVTCCELGDQYFRGARPAPEEVPLTWDEFQEVGNTLARLRQEHHSISERIEHRMRFERDVAVAALREIKRATLEGRVCDDVAWFDQMETLHDFCDRILASVSSPVTEKTDG